MKIEEVVEDKKRKQTRKPAKMIRMNKKYKGIVSIIDIRESLVKAHEKEGWIKES